MRRFHVWLGSQSDTENSFPTDHELVEMPDTATDKQCEEACADCLDVMISNRLDTGWDELEDGEELPK